MKKILVWFLILISLAVLILRFSDKWVQFFFGIKPTSGISILSQPAEATVYLNNEEVGKTPYENKNLSTGDYIIKIEKAGSIWQGKTTLTPGTITIINRDLSPDSTQAAGEILNLDKGKSLIVVSNPDNADIEIDGKPSGKTPLTININSGEHTILISHPNYLRRSIQANIPDDYALTVSVDLAQSETDLTTIPVPLISLTPELVVKKTPVGFLRVRDKPNINGKEITQVKTGDTLTLLEELAEWDKIRLSDGTEGFVSSLYVTKKP